MEVGRAVGLVEVGRAAGLVEGEREGGQVEEGRKIRSSPMSSVETISPRAMGSV